MFRGPCSAEIAGGLTCGENTCETGDYCGYDTIAGGHGLFTAGFWHAGNKHVCIKMYSRDTNKTFGSPTKFKLREVESALPCLHPCFTHVQ